MNTDISAKIAEFSYGKSDKVNSPQNQSAGFQRGFKDGCKRSRESGCDLIGKEFDRIGRPLRIPKDFKEYKRGLWAGIFQTLQNRTP